MGRRAAFSQAGLRPPKKREGFEKVSNVSLRPELAVGQPGGQTTDVFEPAPLLQPHPALPRKPQPRRSDLQGDPRASAPPERKAKPSVNLEAPLFSEFAEITPPESPEVWPVPPAPVGSDLYDLGNLHEMAAALAVLLDDEADLRGIDP